MNATVQSLLAANRADDAITLVARAAASGDAAALFQQGLWHLIGSPLSRDLPRARALLRAAAEGGHHEARLIDIALTANGTGAPADWRAARTLLDRHFTTDSNVRRLATLIDAMDLDADGAPASPVLHEDLTPSGSVRVARGLLTPRECAHIVGSVGDLLAPAMVVDPRTGRQVPHPVRTSDAALIGPIREDPVVRAINRRVAAVSDTDIRQGEALTVLRYNPGQQFRMHLDTLPGTRNQRVKTVLLYLNDGFEGGETVFPDEGLTIVPRIGDALIFTNTLPSGAPDPRARHAGLPVRRGVKWLATRWIRARPFDVWTGPESA